MKEGFFLDRIQMNSAGVSANKAEKPSVAILPHLAKASLARRDKASPGTQLAANRSSLEWLVPR